MSWVDFSYYISTLTKRSKRFEILNLSSMKIDLHLISGLSFYTNYSFKTWFKYEIFIVEFGIKSSMWWLTHSKNIYYTDFMNILQNSKSDNYLVKCLLLHWKFLKQTIPVTYIIQYVGPYTFCTLKPEILPYLINFYVE